MNKKDAIKQFGSVINLAAALGISRQAVYLWPEQLGQRTQDEINGAALRLGIEKSADKAA